MARFIKHILISFLVILFGAGVRPAIGQTVPNDPKEFVLRQLLNSAEFPPYKWFASTDPKHRNEDYLLLTPGETRTIPLAMGQLERLWSTALAPEKISLTLRLSRRDVPSGGNRGTTSLELMRDGRAITGTYHEKAYILYPWQNGIDAEWLADGAALIVTNRDAKENKFFYQVSVRPVNEDSLLSAQNAILTPPAEKIEDVSGSIAPGAERNILTASGVGILRSLQITLDKTDFQAWRDLRLRAKWDGQQDYAIDIPLLSLTGQFWQADKSQSAMWSFDGKTLHLNWPMPWKSSANVTFYNSGQSAVNVKSKIRRDATVRDVDVPAQRFYAAYGSTQTTKGRPVPILKVTGSGAFVGMAMAIAPVPTTQRYSFAYLEGNETITADKRIYEGTGTEDYFNSAWYFPEKPFSQPYGGMTAKEKSPPKVSMYRLMIPDSVPFKNSFKFDFEQGSHNNSDDLQYHWAAFWYQTPGGKFEIVDALRGKWGASSDGEVNGVVGDMNQAGNWRKAIPSIIVIWLFGLGLFLYHRYKRTN